MGIAETLASLPENPKMKVLSDRSANIDNVLEDILHDWQYDLFARKPAPAYKATGEFKGTDLDMATFMSALADRQAVINLPEYVGRREKTYKSNEWVVSPENRHGQIIGLNANSDVFSFSVKILDYNVMDLNAGKLGVPRNYMLADLNGKLYGGFDRIEFVPDADVNDFLYSKSMVSYTNAVIFKHFVHPNAWSSFYGHHYDLAKAGIARGTEEAKYYRKTAKKLIKEGIMLKKKTNGVHKIPPEVVTIPGQKETVESLLVELDFPMHEEYPEVERSSEGLEYTLKRANMLSYKTVPRLKFSARAAELAFRNTGKNGENMPGFPVPEWQRKIKLPGRGRHVYWNMLDYENGIRKRFRVRTITESVR